MRIKKLIQEQNYRPNPVGRVLQRQGQQYRLAAIFFQSDAVPFLREGMEQGAQDELWVQVGIAFHEAAFPDAAAQAAAIDQSIAEKVNGILIQPIFNKL